MDSVERLIWYDPASTAPPPAVASLRPVATFTDADALQRTLATAPPTVVVVPNDEATLTAALGATHGHAPVVVVLDGEAENETALQALRRGADEVVRLGSNPTDVDHVLARAWARFDRGSGIEALPTDVASVVEAAQESEARMRALIEALPDAIVRIDSTGLVLDFHVPASFPSALLPTDVVGLYAQDVVPADMKQPYAEAALGALMTGEPVTFRHTTYVDGAARHHEIRCVPHAPELLALIRDLTAQVEAEAALQERERLIRHVVSTVPVIVFALDATGRFSLIEGRGLDDIGRTREELLGNPVADFFGDNDGVMDALATALDGRAGETLVALRGHHFDLWFRPVFDRDDELTRIIGVAANVSELVATQAELEDSRGALRELAAHLQHIREEERSALSREVHDRLGQMLTSLRLDVSWVARHLDRADTEGLQARLARVNTQIDETIQHVRHIAQALRPSILDDIGLASALEWHAQQFADRAGVACTVTASLDTDEADIPEAAATALFRIAQEALTNVARHADATEVGLHLEEADGDLVLHVIDDGRGFSLAADAPVRSLGLLGMRERASILGGTVAFEGEPGVGTHVRAAVPLR